MVVAILVVRNQPAISIAGHMNHAVFDGKNLVPVGIFQVLNPGVEALKVTTIEQLDWTIGRTDRGIARRQFGRFSG